MESNLAYLSLDRCVKYMKILGLYPINRESSKYKKILHCIYRCVILSLVLLYTVQQILKVYEVRDKADKVMATMFLFLTNTDFIYKVVVLWTKSDQIEEIFQITKGPIYNQEDIEHRAPLQNTIRESLLVVRFFNYISMFTCFLWCVQPTVQHLQGKPIELPIWLPFDVNCDPNFYLAILYMWIQTTWLAMSNTIIDGLIAFSLEQCKTQITIIRLDLENIVQKCKREIEDTPASFSNILENRLKKLIIHHKEVVKMATKVQDIFGNAVFYLFFVGGWILCTSAYRMVTVSPVSVEFISMVFYINCILIELFLYCYYGNEITFETNMLMKSAYATDWQAFPIKHRRILIMFMERIKVPIQPMAGSLVPLSNSSFVSIVRSSYTFYAFLKNSDKSMGGTVSLFRSKGIIATRKENFNMELQLSYFSLHRHIQILRTLGLYSLDRNSSKFKKALHGIYRCIIFAFILLYTFQEILKIYEGRHDADKMMETIFLFLTYTDFIYKVVVVWMKSDQIEEILQIMRDPIYNQGDIAHRDPLLNTIRASFLFVRTFNLMTLFTCFLWALQPTIQHVKGKSIEIAIWLPFDVNRNPNFYFAILYMFFQTSFLGLGNSTIDSFITFMLEQCKTQMKILRVDLENIVERCKLETTRTSISFSDDLEMRLRKMILHHREIVKMVKNVQDIFGNVVFYLFVVGGWILCTSAYRMVSINQASVEFASMALYICCILLELFIYCFFGNEITFESNMLMDSAYASDWLAFPLKHRRTLIIFMERIKCPIKPVAGYLVPLANSTFVSILRSSYTFYAFLKNSDKDSVN
ncbi:uncharacterized protein LOC106137634 [Amyelois transitella]|uniref:uncharacterized protein LOC106137634 n=1 Tax=Amyelois transitella TaxID=680683 RepID=UPI00298F40EB|nr:uncharacterized protein LOC106137634 [Amyelois transitella]